MKRGRKDLSGSVFFDHSKKTYGDWRVLYSCDPTNRWFKCVQDDRFFQFTYEYIMSKERY